MDSFTTTCTPIGGFVDPLTPFQWHNKLIIKQQKEWLEIFTGWECQNKYVILDSENKPLLYCGEETDMCARACLGAGRNFTFNIVDPNSQMQIVRLQADVACCDQTVIVQAPAENTVATIYREFAWFTPTLHIRDVAGVTLFRIESSFGAAFGSFSDVDFPVKDTNNTVVAIITKHYRGFFTEMFTDADNFSVEFHHPLNNQTRAVILACVFHIDMVFYERKS